MRRLGHETLVDQKADALAHGQGDRRSDHQGQQGQQRLLAVRADEIPTQAHGLALAGRKPVEHGGTPFVRCLQQPTPDRSSSAKELPVMAGVGTRTWAYKIQGTAD
ncbi:hypothetical protein D3C77_176640 [compost metagenome]